MGRKPIDLDFEDFFAARALHLRRVAYLIVHDWQAAEDVVQDAFVKLYVRWGSIRSESAEAYVRRAVVNESISMTRRPRRELTTASPPDAPARIDPELSAEIPLAVWHLPPSQRAVVALRYLDDLSVAEVAQVLQISEGTVKSQSSKALRQLRKAHTSEDHDTFEQARKGVPR